MTRSIPVHKQTDMSKQAGQHVYGFDREPYLKHSNVAPDVTLSDYIARKQEEPKRMTFDGWFKTDEAQWIEQTVHNECTSFEEVVEALEMLWNAALKQGKL